MLLEMDRKFAESRGWGMRFLHKKRKTTTVVTGTRQSKIDGKGALRFFFNLKKSTVCTAWCVSRRLMPTPSAQTSFVR